MALKKREFTPESGSVDTYGLRYLNVTRAPWTVMEIHRFSIQKAARPSGTNLQLAAETWEFAQVPWCLWDINVP